MTRRHDVHLLGSCDCGVCGLDIQALPKHRFICHCLFCQEFTGEPFNDVSVTWARAVAIRNPEHLVFKKYRPPPNVNRGRCDACGKPVVEFTGFGPLKLAFVPANAVKSSELLPPVKMHIFYDRRVHDVSDDLPKYQHYWPSQLAVARLFMQGV